MSARRQRRVAASLGLASALLVTACTFLLVTAHHGASGRAPAEKRRIDALVAQVKVDPGSALALHEERERQTTASLARESRGRLLAWIVLAAGAIGVACGKWYLSLRPAPAPELEDLVSARRAVDPVPLIRPPALVTPPERDDSDSAASAIAVVDELVDRLGDGPEAAIPILQGIQSRCRYLPDEALRRLCEVTRITPAQIAGTASFYAQFRHAPMGRYTVRVCHGTACHVAGIEQITRELRRHLDIPADEDTDPRRLFTLDPVACLGCCSLAPVMMVEADTVGHLTPTRAVQALDALGGPT